MAVTVRISAGSKHSQALMDDGRVFVFGTTGGIPDAGDDGCEWQCESYEHMNPADAECCDHVFSCSDDDEEIRSDDERPRCEDKRPHRQLLPCLLQGALTDTTASMLGSGPCAKHSVCVPGTPPLHPGFDPLEMAAQHSGGGAAAASTQHPDASRSCRDAPAPKPTALGGATAAAPESAAGTERHQRRGCHQCGAQTMPDGSKLKKCSACKRARYCSDQCQHTHWPTHKGKCAQRSLATRVAHEGGGQLYG